MSILFSILVILSHIVNGEEKYNGWTKELSEQLIPSGNWRMAIAEYNETIYLLGGYITDSASKSLILYDIDSNIFIEDDNISTVSINGIGQYYTVYDNILYMINPAQTTLLRYDLEQDMFYDTWNSVEIPINVLDAGCLASYNNYLFIIGGANNGTSLYSNNVQILNISSELWLDTMNIPKLIESRGGSSCIIHPNNHQLYVISGYSNDSFPTSQYSNTIEYIYINDIENIISYSWNYVIGNLSRGLAGSRAIIYGNDILIIGGYHYNGIANYEDFINVIDITTDSILPDTGGYLDYGIVGGAPIIVNQRLYVFGGNAGGVTPNWQYLDLLSNFIHLLI